MKQNYSKPQSELLRFRLTDVLTESEETTEPTNTGGIGDTDNPGGTIEP